ncbi:hypothetical protein TWF481_008131 [Arthrobotrys musiformis]|uniref:Uncharacterized protein n=1 Tax=Arthrobotrys musiformis TaxID=47236 RepID=A0AAV9W682_9PEZI
MSDNGTAWLLDVRANAPPPYPPTEARMSANADTSSGVVTSGEEAKPNRKLRGGRLRNNFSELFFRLFLAVCSSVFIVLAVFAYSVDGKDVQRSSDGRQLLEIIKWGPTVFPIIFAAIVGDFLQSVALRRAQKGAKLGTLEQLTRTINIFTAITTPYFIRAYNWLSILLLSLWAISPLGGQASLRLLSTRPVTVRTAHSVRFLSPTNVSSYLSTGGRNYGTWRVQAESLYTASLLGTGASKYRTLDPWDNVRVPYIEELERQTPEPGLDGWYDVTNQNVTYSSLLGIPIRGLASNITVTVPTSYSKLNCSYLDVFRNDECFQNTTDRCFDATRPHIPDWFFPFARANRGWDYGYYMLVGMNVSQTAFNSSDGNDSPEPLDLIFESGGRAGTSVAWCKLSQTYLEAEVTCPASRCAVSKVRRLSIGTERPPLFYKTTPGKVGTLSNFLTDFSLVAKSGKPSYSNFNQGYIYNPDDPIAGTADWVDLVDVGIQNFEVRATQLMNTLLAAAQGPALYLSNYDIRPYNYTYSPALGRVVVAESAAGESTRTREFLICYKSWSIVLLFCAVLLFTMGVSSAILACTTLAPDALTSLSALAAESRFFDVEHGGSTLDRDEKAIALKERVVKLGDVEASNGIGYIALGTIDTYKGAVGDLSKGRVYK